MHYYLSRISKACEVLLKDDDYKNVSCIAIIHWTVMPEATKQIKSVVVDGNRITEYMVGNTRIIEVYPYGKFQII
jgi:hypothetical protein